MPRPNQPRSIASEEALAQRITQLREARGWSLEGLASRMTKVGCAIQGSAIYKIEKAGRRITVDELVGFSEVFGVPVNELLLSPETVYDNELTRMVVRWHEAGIAASAAQEAHDTAWDELVGWLKEHPDRESRAEVALRMLAEFRWGPEKSEAAAAYWMYEATGASEWKERYGETLTPEQRARWMAAD